MQIFQNQQEASFILRSFAGPGAQAVEQQGFQGGAAVFGFERLGKFIFGDRQAKQLAEQRQRLQAVGGQVFDFAFQAANLAAQGRFGVQVEEGRPDRLPDQVRGVRAVRLAASPRPA